ncbi:MAG: hypothetical protein H7Y05_02365 [Steroidobacteraceae bacterium]|nr:hypothetical protein [Deltaproteobacteria bacterium]
MKLKKTVAIAAAAGALTAVAMPAMAFENEFHGMYKLKYFLSNYENGSSGFINPSPQTVTPATGSISSSARKNLKTNNYFEQRARIQYSAKASDDLKLVTQFEIDSVFGDRAQGLAGRGSGGALESDAVNLETKHVYLDFKIPSTPVKVTAGIQAYKDAFKGVLLDADIAGINTVTKLGPATLGLGYFRAYDQSYSLPTFRTTRGIDNLDILALNASFDLSKDLKVGSAYYLYSDDRSIPNAAVGSTNIHTLGVNMDAKLGPLGLSGFAAMQQGLTKGTNSPTTINRVTYNGYAFNAAAKLAVGPGTLRTAALYTTGDDGRDGINTAWQSTRQAQDQVGVVPSGAATNSYNDSNMMLLNRSTNMGGTTTDQNLVYTTNNKNQGVFLYSLGFDAKLGSKAYANVNAGMAWASKTNSSTATARPRDLNTRSVAGTNYLGTEVNFETGYKMYDNLTGSLQAAYVLLGGYYENTLANGKSPADPYTARVVLSYAF